MTRTRQLLTGAAALAAVLALVGGVPWALTHFIGWPLPHAFPSWQQLWTGLTTRGIPDALLLKTLALIVWAGWAVLALSLTSEALAAVGGLRHRPLPLTGPLQPATATLITAISVALLAVLPNGGHPHTTQPLGLSLTTGATSSTAERTPGGMVPRVAAASGAISGSPATGLTQPDPGVAFTSGRPAVSTAPEPERYVVQRRDTLWGIAAAHLGDPLRWHQLFELNAGRPQPDGQTLTDPGQIRPGWTLLLPPPAIAAPHRDTAHPARSHRPAAAPRSDLQPVGTSSPAAPDDGSQPPRHLTAPAPSAAASRTVSPRPPDPSAPGPSQPVPSSRPDPRAQLSRVDLDRHDTPDRGGQLLVPAALLAGLSAASALALLHRRRRYRPQPAARRRVEREPLADRLHGLPTLRAAPVPEPAGPDAARPSSEGLLSPAESSVLQASPGRVALGLGDDGRELIIDLLDGDGLTLAGQGAPAAARSLLLTLLAQSDLPDTDANTATGLEIGGGKDPKIRRPPAPPLHPAVLLLGGAAAELLPDTELQAVRRGEMNTLLEQAASELRHRQSLHAAYRDPRQTPRVSDSELPADDELSALRSSYPDEPLSLVVLAISDPTPAAVTDLARLARRGAQVGITVLTILSTATAPTDAPTSVAAGAETRPKLFRITATGELTGHSRAPERSVGSTTTGPARAFGLDKTQTARLLGLLEAAAGAAAPCFDTSMAATPWCEPERERRPAANPSSDPTGYPTELADGAEPVAADRQHDDKTATAALVRLQLLGPMTVLVSGVPVDGQLRSKSLELLAYLSCHDRGATADALAETLWPQAPPQRSRARLHTTVANTRTVLRAASGHPEHAFVTLQHGRYQLQPGVSDSDVMTFRRALRHIAEQPPAADLLGLLRGAASTFTGEPLAGITADWAEPIRESLRMQGLDLFLQLAELHRNREENPAEVAALTRARQIDPYAEEVTRRLIAGHIRAGERSAALRAFHDLEERLADLGVDPDPGTRDLLTPLRRSPPRDRSGR